MANENEIKLHDLRPAPGSTKQRKRVGRGNAGGGGTYGGRGRKGQGARSGGVKQPYFEGGQLPLVRRLPRKRGFTNIFRVEYRIVNVGRLAELFGDSDEISPDTMLARGIIKKGNTPVKVLAEGDIGKALTIHAHAFSKGAREKIEAAGGTVVVLEGEDATEESRAEAPSRGARVAERPVETPRAEAESDQTADDSPAAAATSDES